MCMDQNGGAGTATPTPPMVPGGSRDPANPGLPSLALPPPTPAAPPGQKKGFDWMSLLSPGLGMLTGNGPGTLLSPLAGLIRMFK